MSDDRADDLDLLRRLRAGEADALRELMARYDRLVRFAIFRLCRSECRRDGAFLDSRASETWSGLVESVRRRDRALPHSVKTYLLQIARNKCTDALRRSSAAGVGLDECSDLEARSPAALESIIQTEEVLALRGCIESLTTEEQRVYGQIELIIEGRWTRAGEVLGLPESTLRTRWAAIMDKLRGCLGRKTGKTYAPPSDGPDS
jgi:RNA polymerase sigma factor (sigma-70 family)